jgi:hypothetical protein
MHDARAARCGSPAGHPGRGRRTPGGITVYRYRHLNQEQWNGNCLAAISASTDDHGDATVVKGSASADGFRVVASAGKKTTEATARGCIDVWYQDGRWVGLDTAVYGDRKLSYRLM